MKLGLQFNQQRIGGRYDDVAVFSVVRMPTEHGWLGRL